MSSKIIIIIISSLLILSTGYLFYNVQLNKKFIITRYEVVSSKLKNSFKAIMLVDLHNVEYGQDNKNLIAAIQEEKPDVIFFVGDMINYTTTDFSNLLNLLKKLSKIASIYYSYGNHERYLKSHNKFKVRKQIQNMNKINLIYYAQDQVKIAGNKINIGAFCVSQNDWDTLGQRWFKFFEDPNTFTILLSHFPWVVPDNYPETTVDVILSGHAHGGQIHLWNDLGVYAPGKGLFARYTSGLHKLDNATEIVSRGLGDHTKIPRLHNQPELVVIDFIAEP